MQPKDIENAIKQHIKDADIIVYDIKKTGDHFIINVKSNKFKSITLIEQHKMVMKSLHKYINGKNAQIHAVDIKTSIKSN